MDAADRTGLALGSLSLLGQVLTGCVQGFERYNKVSDIGEQFVDIQATLTWARGRLIEWGSEWGLREGRHREDERLEKYAEMVTSHLVYIHCLLAQLDKAEEVLPTLEAAGAAALSGWSQTGDVSAQQINDLLEKVDKLNSNAGAMEKGRHYLQDGRTARMADRVKSMIDDLWLQFPPPSTVGANAALARSRVLQSDDMAILDAAASNSSQDPTLAALALLKLERLRLEQRSDMLNNTDPEDPPDVIVQGSEVWSGPRGTALYRNDQKLPFEVPVLIEKKEVPAEDRYQRHYDRIRSVARLLSMDAKPREMRSLDCLGIVSTINENHTTTYMLVYRLPTRQFFDLKAILTAERKTPTMPLGKKFTCAKVLCRAILRVHLAGWLHKDIRSDNIIFSAPDESQVNLAEPYLCGFEYTRHIAAPLDTEPLGGDAGSNLYRHPDVQGLPEDSRGTHRPEFQPSHDVYALGMVLLELGSKRSLKGLKEKFEKEFDQRWSAAPFSDWIVSSELGNLTPRMGEMYTDVVRCCLNGLKVDDGLSFQETFDSRVVKKIELCMA
ncbi:HET-s/LopB domain protein [Podospora conica]|nr:HET-s/LopB domain protein [Schizothecium conicum]